MAGLNRAYKRRPNAVALNGAPVLCLDAGSKVSYLGTGTTWTDLSGNANNGTLVNGPTFDSANGGSLVFDGVDDYVSCGTLSIPSGNNARTLSVWVKIGTATGNSGYRSIVCQGTYSANQQFQIGFAGSKFNVNNYTQTWSDSTNAVTNLWYNVAVSYDGTSFILYKNGVNVASASVSLGTVMGNLKLASNPNSLENLNGSISVVQIYNRALTATEVATNFELLRGRYGI